MKESSKISLILISSLLFYQAAYSADIPNTDNPNTFLGPTLRLGYTTTFTDNTAYSLAGEAGLRNFRLGGTLGFKLTENQLFKISAEYLWQKIDYAFFSGNIDHWVDQGAIGAAYVYEFMNSNSWPQLGINAYYSHAPSKTLSTTTGSFVNAQGNPQFFADHRRIAGSNAAGASPGVSIAPWNGGRIGVDLNYDHVRYDNSNGHNENATGWGGTFRLNQALTDRLFFGATAAIRQPFNNYAANLDLNHVQFYGDWTLGLFGDYTVGKDTLPNTWNIGLSANYFFDRRCPIIVPAGLKGEGFISRPITDNLLGWTADPAVYMPQVLAIVDEKVTSRCANGPVLIATIPEFVTGGGPASVATAYAFKGSDLVFSITVNPPVPNEHDSSTFSINPTTGVITMDTFQTLYTVTVTATNTCSSVSTSFNVFSPD